MRQSEQLASKIWRDVRDLSSAPQSPRPVASRSSSDCRSATRKRPVLTHRVRTNIHQQLRHLQLQYSYSKTKALCIVLEFSDYVSDYVWQTPRRTCSWLENVNANGYAPSLYVSLNCRGSQSTALRKACGATEHPRRFSARHRAELAFVRYCRCWRLSGRS